LFIINFLKNFKLISSNKELLFEQPDLTLWLGNEPQPKLKLPNSQNQANFGSLSPIQRPPNQRLWRALSWRRLINMSLI
jgi:hypothetical protein